MSKTPFVFPILGGRKIEHLLANIQALEVSLSPAQVAYLESVVPFDPGFPNTMVGDGTQYSNLMKGNVNLDRQPNLQPICHAKK